MPERFHQVKVTIDGRTYSGDYQLQDSGKAVCVGAAYGSKSAPIGRSTAERVAQRLLKELVEAWLTR